MREPLTLARFEAMADAYGGAVSRWPAAYRDAATVLATQPAARDILDRASALDGALDAWRVAPPAMALRERIVAAAPAPARRIMTRARLWWSGVGVAAALAGAAAGTVAVAITAPIDATPDGATSFGATAFDDVAGSET